MSASKKMSKSSSEKPTERQQFGVFIHRVIRVLELSPNQPIRFSDIASCDKRRQSDLYNILDALDVFGHISEGVVVWRGFGATTAAFVRHGIENEGKAQHLPIEEIFRVGQSPVLGKLVVTFISLFVFLGQRNLNIREAVNIMSDSPEHAKKVLRRLYLVVYILEQIGILDHGYQFSNYLLKLPLDLIISTIFQESPRLPIYPEESIEALLNRLDSVYINTLHAQRREMYQKALTRFGTSDQIQSE